MLYLNTCATARLILSITPVLLQLKAYTAASPVSMLTSGFYKNEHKFTSKFHLQKLRQIVLRCILTKQKKKLNKITNHKKSNRNKINKTWNNSVALFEIPDKTTPLQKLNRFFLINVRFWHTNNCK